MSKYPDMNSKNDHRFKRQQTSAPGLSANIPIPKIRFLCTETNDLPASSSKGTSLPLGHWAMSSLYQKCERDLKEYTTIIQHVCVLIYHYNNSSCVGGCILEAKTHTSCQGEEKSCGKKWLGRCKGCTQWCCSTASQGWRNGLGKTILGFRWLECMHLTCDWLIDLNRFFEPMLWLLS